MGNATASVSLQITARDVLNAGLSRGVIPIQFAQVLELNNGLTDANIDLAWSTTRVGVAASTTIDVDLHGALTDSFGNTVQFHEVVLIALVNNRLDAGAYIVLSPAVSGAPFGRLSGGKGFWPADIAADNDQGNVVGPGAWLCLCDTTGVSTSAGVTDRIQVATSATVGSTNGWSLLILGRSA
jgi:hypothetical protein